MSMQYRRQVPTVSEYEPITKELYEMMDFHYGPYSDEVDTVSADYEQFYLACTKIDSIHAKLEDENQSLKSIIAKLKHNTTVMELFCKNLEDAVKERKDVTLWGVDYAPLPLDADDMPVHVGDMMDTSSFGTVEVEGFVHSAIAFYNYEDPQARLCTSPAKLCHHRKPTVADVLRELVDGIKDQNADFTELAIAEYAKRLQLAEGDAE